MVMTMSTDVELKTTVIDIENVDTHLYLSYVALAVLQQSSQLTSDEIMEVQNAKAKIDDVCNYLEKIRERLLSK